MAIFSLARRPTLLLTSSRRLPSIPTGRNENPLRTAFSTLRTKISPDTLRAVTDKPFNHANIRDESHGPPRDLLVKAKTGTGKTLAFLLPAIEARIKAIDKAGVDALEKNGGLPDARVVENAKRAYARNTVGTVVISPTRELATQITQEAIKLTHWHKNLRSTRFKRGRNDIVVGTPGRIRDILENDPDVAEVLKTATHLVLDEADTLLDMGFRQDIDAIADFFPKTPFVKLSPAIRQVAHEVLHKDHVFIDVASEDSSPVHAHIPQHYTVYRAIAHDQLANPGNSKIMVFLNTTKQTQLFATLLRQLSKTTLPARTQIYEIHSKRTQVARSGASNAFRRDRSGAAILVTSDVSARGIDYPDVTRVIQVGSPVSTEQYVHRVGRTGRAGKGGRADLFLLPLEQNFARYQISEMPIKELTHDKLLNEATSLAESNPSMTESNTINRLFRSNPSTALVNLDNEISALLDEIDREAIEEVFVSLVGYYFGKASDMRVTRQSIYEGLQAWTTEACGLPKAPIISDALLAKMGGLRGGSSSRGAQRGPPRRSFGFKPPATRYDNSERNRRWNEQTDRKVASGRRWGDDKNSGHGERNDGEWRSSRGSRFSRDGERGDGGWRKSNRSSWNRDSRD
ncbi:P-loop containing nucleoside triphosphate hydrolase protein [Russula vinacea]|nr:P-loop containing nucleoside triphosphate hydrolase protein [Russula vinacea]